MKTAISRNGVETCGEVVKDWNECRNNQSIFSVADVSSYDKILASASRLGEGLRYDDIPFVVSPSAHGLQISGIKTMVFRNKPDSVRVNGSIANDNYPFLDYWSQLSNLTEKHLDTIDRALFVVHGIANAIGLTDWHSGYYHQYDGKQPSVLYPHTDPYHSVAVNLKGKAIGLSHPLQGTVFNPGDVQTYPSRKMHGVKPYEGSDRSCVVYFGASFD